MNEILQFKEKNNSAGKESQFVFSFFDFMLYEAILLICEYIQIMNGEKTLNFILHLTFFTLFIIFVLMYVRLSSNN